MPPFPTTSEGFDYPPEVTPEMNFRISHLYLWALSVQRKRYSPLELHWHFSFHLSKESQHCCRVNPNTHKKRMYARKDWKGTKLWSNFPPTSVCKAHFPSTNYGCFSFKQAQAISSIDIRIVLFSKTVKCRQEKLMPPLSSQTSWQTQSNQLTNHD